MRPRTYSSHLSFFSSSRPFTQRAPLSLCFFDLLLRRLWARARGGVQGWTEKGDARLSRRSPVRAPCTPDLWPDSLEEKSPLRSRPFSVSVVVTIDACFLDDFAGAGQRHRSKEVAVRPAPTDAALSPVLFLRVAIAVGLVATPTAASTLGRIVPVRRVALPSIDNGADSEARGGHSMPDPCHALGVEGSASRTQAGVGDPAASARDQTPQLDRQVGHHGQRGRACAFFFALFCYPVPRWPRCALFFVWDPCDPVCAASVSLSVGEPKKGEAKAAGKRPKDTAQATLTREQKKREKRRQMRTVIFLVVLCHPTVPPNRAARVACSGRDGVDSTTHPHNPPERERESAPDK